MEEEFKKKQRIDEEAMMMALMVDGVRLKGFTESELNTLCIGDEQEETKEIPKKRKRAKKEQIYVKEYDIKEYEELFFKDVKSTARHGKSVYIDPEHHKILSRIVQVIADDKLTIYAYLHNLLEHHFNEFEQ